MQNVYSHGDTEYMYTLVQDAVSGKTKLRQRREKGQPSYSDTDSEWSSLERRQRAAEVYCKVNRKPGTHKRPRKKRTAIPVQPPRVPQLQNVNVPVHPSANVLGEREREREQEQLGEKGGQTDSNSESSEGSDVEQYPGQMPVESRHRFQKRTFSLKKRLPIPASIPIPPELHNTHNLNIQLNSSELFTSKLNSYGNVHDDESSLDVSSPRDNNSPMVRKPLFYFYSSTQSYSVSLI